jgi:hypothetical protein
MPWAGSLGSVPNLRDLARLAVQAGPPVTGGQRRDTPDADVRQQLAEVLQAEPVADAPVVNSAAVRLRSELPWISEEHRCEHRAAAADRKLYADEYYKRLRVAVVELEQLRAARIAILAVHRPVPTWTDSTLDTVTRQVEQNALHDDMGELVYAPDYRVHCATCPVDMAWPCPTARALGVPPLEARS